MEIFYTIYYSQCIVLRLVIETILVYMFSSEVMDWISMLNQAIWTLQILSLNFLLQPKL